MAEIKKDIRKIAAGIVLILLAAVTAAAAFYFLEIKPRWISGRPAAPESAQKPAGLPEASSVSSKNGGDKKEGFLWADPQSSQWVISLGETNGLSSGRTFAVYDGDNKIGEVRVEKSFEAVSYVRPVSGDLSGKNYYRVAAE